MDELIPVLEDKNLKNFSYKELMEELVNQSKIFNEIHSINEKLIGKKVMVSELEKNLILELISKSNMLMIVGNCLIKVSADKKQIAGENNEKNN